ARALHPGRPARPRAGPDLPPGRGQAALRRHEARGAQRSPAAPARVRVRPGRPVARGGREARAAARRPRREGRGPVRARRPRRPRGAPPRRLRRLRRPPASVPSAPRPRGRRDPRPMTTAERAYAEVERITRRRARNFAYGIMVLPRSKRRAIAAIYAFAREVDDLADGDLPAGEKRDRLERLRSALDAEPD